jgi:cytochrome d ubiquinol oxidase subunit II
MLLVLHPLSPSGLDQLWFFLILVLWLGYFFLEGFDFGVGTLLPFVSKDDLDRRTVINTIGPVWDGNEVWLITAGGATFAAFPLWYATVFSGFYLALFLILAALIFRGMAFEFRHKREDAKWVKWWDRAIFWGSALPALLWGVAFADFVHGVPLAANATWTGNFFDLVKPYALLGGLSTLSLFTLHGSTYLGLKTDGDVRVRAHKIALRLAPITFVLVAAFLAWTYQTAHTMHHEGLVPPLLPIVGLLVLAGVGWLVRDHFEGWAFIATAVVIVAFFATLFLNLYPNVLISSVSPHFDITIVASASHRYTLEVMSWVALIFTPLVLLYQSWTYWIFKKRVSRPGDASETQHSPTNV